MKRLISIVIPVFNEDESLDRLFTRLRPVIKAIESEFGFRTEVVVNDNCSTDKTADKLAEIIQRHVSTEFDLRVYRFSRNVGFQRSILAGYIKARGDAVVQIDADLQDPPELILEFITKWIEGARVVYGVRRRRKESILMSLTRKAFYRILNRLSADELPPDSGDFRLIDRVIVDIVCEVQDQDPYLRGLIAGLGFKQVGVVYDRDARNSGKSKFNIGDLIKLGLDGFTNHSVALLRLSSYFAFFVALTMVCFIAFYLYGWLMLEETLPVGFMTQTLLQLGGIAVISLLFSIHGEYLSRIYRQVKQRPLAIIEKEMNSVPEERMPDSKPEVLWFGDRSSNREI